MSLRLKLTFLYSGVLAFILLSFGSLVYFFLERNLSVETDRSVAEIAQELIHSTKIVGPHSLRQVVLPNLDVFATPSTYIQVIDRYGTIVAQSVNLGRQSMPIHEVKPLYNEPRYDLVQQIRLGSPDKVLAFCRGLQAASPVDSYVRPEAEQMPGYDDPVVMAAGTFVQGASLELSADGPLRPPYNVYMQGGLSKEYVRLAAISAAEAIATSCNTE
jgi:hypothetical protein